MIAGVPFWFLVAFFGGLSCFIPYVGVALTAITALFLTYLGHHTLDWHLAVVLGTVILAQVLEGNFLTPKIVGDQVGLNPVWVILAVLVFGNFLGFLGLLLAVPIAATLKVLVVEVVERYKKSPVYTGGPGGSGGGEASAPSGGSA
jgi:predicted PurR-regulated permease PerM